MPVLVLTGCTSGLGLVVLGRVLEHLGPSSTVFAGHRTRCPPTPTPTTRSAQARLVWIPLDLASTDSVDHFADSVREHLRVGTSLSGAASASIDCILLNAATWNLSFRPVSLTGPGQGATLAEEYVVNHLSQVRLVRHLVPLLKPQHSRIVFTSSSLQNSLALSSLDGAVDLLRDPTHPQSTPRNRYAASKLVQSIAFGQLHTHLETEQRNGVDIVGVSPGFVPTTRLSRDSPWWQQIVMRWLVYYLPFCSTEVQGATKILECLDYLFPTNPFPSTLGDRLCRERSPHRGPQAHTSSSRSNGVVDDDNDDPSSSSAVVFHPPSLSPLESSSTAPLYRQLREFLQRPPLPPPRRRRRRQDETGIDDRVDRELEEAERTEWETVLKQIMAGTEP